MSFYLARWLINDWESFQDWNINMINFHLESTLHESTLSSIDTLVRWHLEFFQVLTYHVAKVVIKFFSKLLEEFSIIWLLVSGFKFKLEFWIWIWIWTLQETLPQISFSFSLSNLSLILSLDHSPNPSLPHDLGAFL